VILTLTSSDKIFIENWAMSCRVLERGMENFIINYLQEFCVSKNIEIIIAEYIETAKNSIVRDLYLKLGFDIFENKYSLNTHEKKTLDNKIKIYDGKK